MDYISVESLGNGVLDAYFQRELDLVLDNIADPNTPAEKKREIILTVTIIPDKTREIGIIAVNSKNKLAPTEGYASHLTMGEVEGKHRAIENRQLSLFDEEEETIGDRSARIIKGSKNDKRSA